MPDRKQNGEGSSTPVPLSDRALELHALLCDFGVHAGHAEPRAKLADALEKLGMQPADLTLLGESAQQTEDSPHRAAKLLAWRLQDSARWSPMLVDLKRMMAKVDATKAKEIEHYPNAPRGAWYCNCAGCVAFRAKQAARPALQPGTYRPPPPIE